ncbi:MAG: hypothetical protein GEU97_24655 [Actinophytocola sp.]|nr:hypothetical protein [Actinophytocola sp.]
MVSDGGSAGAMIGHDMRITTAENYRRFAVEVAGRSPAYGALAAAVAAGDDVALTCGRRRSRRASLDRG